MHFLGSNVACYIMTMSHLFLLHKNIVYYLPRSMWIRINHSEFTELKSCATRHRYFTVGEICDRCLRELRDGNRYQHISAKQVPRKWLLTISRCVSLDGTHTHGDKDRSSHTNTHTHTRMRTHSAASAASSTETHTCAHGDSLICRHSSSSSSSHDHSGALTFSQACNLFTKVQTGRTTLSLFLPCKPLTNSRADQNGPTTKSTNKYVNIRRSDQPSDMSVSHFSSFFFSLSLSHTDGKTGKHLSLTFAWTFRKSSGSTRQSSSDW